MACTLVESPSLLVVAPPPGLEDLTPLSVSEASRRSSLHSQAPRPIFSSALEANEPVKLARTAGGRLVTTLVDGVLPPGESWKTASMAAAGTDSQSTASGGQSPCSSPKDEVEEDAPKKKKSRFCKAKRDHYRRLVEQLVQQVKEDPGNFSLDGVRLPRSIATCEDSKNKLIATVKRFAAGDAEA